MNRRNLRRILMISVLSCAFPAAALRAEKPPSTWMVGVLGGDDPNSILPNFYNDAQGFLKLSEDFKIPRKNTTSLSSSFTGHGNRYCTKKEAPKARAHNQELKRQLLAKEGEPDCAPVDEILASLIEPSGSIDCVDAPGKMGTRRLTSAKSGVHEALGDVRDQGQSGDHALISLDDHGFQTPDGSAVTLGDNPISSYALENELLPLEQKGIWTHLNVIACFGGGFLPLTTSPLEKGGTCVVSSSNSKRVTYGDDDYVSGLFDGSYYANLGRLGSQLKAFACSTAADPWNLPETSLDQVIADFEQARIEMTKTGCSLPEKNPSGSVIMPFQPVIAFGGKDEESKLRDDMTELFQKDVVETAKGCEAAQTEAIQFAKAIVQCLPKTKLDAETQTFFRDIFAPALADKRPHVKMIEKHLRFLKEADLPALQKYKSAACCLDYDFGTRRSPSICHNI